MNINIMMKSIAKTRNIVPIQYIIKDDIKTIGDLIENLVHIEIDKYEQNEFKVLSQDDIDAMLTNGKITFGFKYRDEEIDRDNAVKVALQGFEDGLFVIFINEEQYENINDEPNLKENDELSIVRLTMFTGRYY